MELRERRGRRLGAGCRGGITTVSADMQAQMAGCRGFVDRSRSWEGVQQQSQRRTMDYIHGMDGRVERPRGRQHPVGFFGRWDEAVGSVEHRHCTR